MNPGTRPWSPKFPGLAVSPQQGVGIAVPTSTAAWGITPDTSHVYGYRLFKTGQDGDDYYIPPAGAPAGTVAFLSVAFKPAAVKGKHPNSIKSEYYYFFTSLADGKAWLQLFSSAPHPGQIVNSLISAGIPYKRIY